MASAKKPNGGVDSTRMGGVKNNPFLKQQSMETQFVKERRKSRGLNAIGRGRISSILAKWNQQTHKNNNDYLQQKTQQRPKPKDLQPPSPKQPSEPIHIKIEQHIPSSFDKTEPPQNQPDINRMQSTLSNQQQKNISLQKHNTSLRHQLATLDTTNSALHDTHNTLRQNVNKLSKSLSSMETDLIISLKQQQTVSNADNFYVLQLKEQVLSLRTQLLTESENAQHGRQQDRFINELKHTISENENAINQLNKAKDEEINTLIADNKFKDNDIDQYINNIESAISQIEQQKYKTNAMEQTLLNKNANNQQEIDEYTSKMLALRHEKEDKISELSDRVIQMDQTFSGYNVSVTAIKQKNTDLTGKNEQLIIQNMALTERSNGMKELLIKIQTLEHENRQLAEEQNIEIKMEVVEIEEDYIPNINDENINPNVMHNEEEYVDIEDEDDNIRNVTDEFIDFEDPDMNGKQGWLEKQSRFLRKWKKKYVRIAGGYFCIFDDETCNEFQCDAFDLTVMQLIYSFDNVTEFGLQNNENAEDVMSFRCSEESEADEWMTYIRHVMESEEFVSVDTETEKKEESEELHEEFVNVNNGLQNEKVHKLAMGLNIPMGGSLLKKKKARMQSGQIRELRQQEFEKPMISSNVRSPKKRANITPNLINTDNDLGNVDGLQLANGVDDH